MSERTTIPWVRGANSTRHAPQRRGNDVNTAISDAERLAQARSKLAHSLSFLKAGRQALSEEETCHGARLEAFKWRHAIWQRAVVRHRRLVRELEAKVKGE